jgi:low affinity Fe/Cu permease
MLIKQGLLKKMKNRFRSLASRVSTWAGSPYVFFGAIVVVVLWASSGPAANFSDTWQLIINTSTTIVTFLMVFLIQNTQNRDAKAMQLKLDELIKSSGRARDVFVGLEDISDEELLEIADEFRKLHDKSAPTAAMNKLRKKIEAEHMKRATLRSISGRVITTMFNPLGKNSSQSKK